MRTRIVWLTAILLIGFVGLQSSPAQDASGNFLINGGFEDGVLAPWNTYGNVTTEVVRVLTGAAVPEPPVEGDYCLHVVVPAAGANFWDSGLQPAGEVFKAGKRYTVSAFFKTKQGTLQINMKPELAINPWTGYGEQVVTINDKWAEYSVTTPVFAQDVSPAGFTFHIAFAPGDFWVDGVRFYEGEYAPPAFKKRLTAKDPSPDDGATDVPQDTMLSWTTGPFADKHNVYFGTAFDDVNTATVASPNVLASLGQTGTMYDPPGLLDFGQTYYWRVDEVNAPPDSTVYKGDVWSFTVEPYSYPITNITATASSSAENQGPEKTIDASGLNAADQHSTEPTHMWLSEAGGPQPSWIQYDFDAVYKLLEMQVWNSNQLLESVLGLGARSVTIEYSQDGATWTSLGDYEFARAPGRPTYVHNTTIDLSSVVAQSVRLTINSNWTGLLQQYGLSEVRFLYVPVQARAPQPASGTSDVPLDAVLDWRSGREAVSHEVYLSDDEQAVIGGTALAAAVTESFYQAGPLDYGQTYYWKVNEVNDLAPTPSWEGNVWNFSTVEYAMVEDFEAYSAENPVWENWLDGLGFGAQGTPGYTPGNGTGSVVGDETSSSTTEEVIVFGGNQAMPVLYDNNRLGAAAKYSEVEHALGATSDWTASGASHLSLWFRGYPGSVGGFVENPAGTFTVTGSGADITGTADQFHYAYKRLTGAGSIVARVQSIQNTNNWAKAGVMIRDTLDAGSGHAMAFVTPANGVVFEYRPSEGGTNVGAASQQAGLTAPQWVKLDRTIGGTFTASYSSDGVTWQQLGNNPSASIQMTNPSVYIGLAVTSHDAAVTCDAVFSNVTATGSVTGQWVSQDVGILSNAPEPIYVALSDNAGGSGVVAHDDTSATQADAWTEWVVALQDFADQGVNLTRVSKIALGVGTKGNMTTPGGSGKMFFDEIRVGHPLQQAVGNMLVNGGFEDGVLAPWGFWGDATAEVVQQIVGATVPEGVPEGRSCLHITVNSAGANNWDYGLNQGGLAFKKGKQYTFSAFLKCKEGTLQIRFKPELAQAPYTGYGEQVITMTDQWAEYSVTTPVFAQDTSPGSATFHIAFAAGEFWIDNVRFYEGEPAPAGSANAVVVGDFEGGLGGWEPRDATLSVSATGATLGAQAMQVDGPGGWHLDGLVDIKAHRQVLGTPGAKVTADVTAFAADMTTQWMQVGMVVNAQNNNDAGENNNIGWQDLGSQDLPRDGEPHTLTWMLSDALTTSIAGADDNIWWFELALISNLDGASVTKFYVDNVQLIAPAP